MDERGSESLEWFDEEVFLGFGVMKEEPRSVGMKVLKNFFVAGREAHIIPTYNSTELVNHT